MAAFSVTPEYVSAASVQCGTTASDVLVQLDQLRKYVTELVGVTDAANGPADAFAWMGVTAEQFAGLMDNVHTYSIAMHDALVQIGDGLQGNYVNYVNSEGDNLNGMKNIDNGLLTNVPQANL
ncbi:WXG100 family type VII secretion target [Actinoplanes sp. NPDC049265]|uniref:WXG100 family type VII secretion target n=1 Tax=Actinoplanes sp. NPDC049265 TaxID=3363902 RepID=UPI003719DB42